MMYGDKMKAFLSIKYHTDAANQEKIQDIVEVLEESGFEVSCMTTKDYNRDEEMEAEELMKETFEEIDSSDLMFVDLTEKGVGLGIETGYARSQGIPVYTIADKGSDISKTLEGISEEIIEYESPGDLADKLKRI